MYSARERRAVIIAGGWIGGVKRFEVMERLRFLASLPLASTKLPNVRQKETKLLFLSILCSRSPESCVDLFEVRLTKPNESKTSLNALHKSF